MVAGQGGWTGYLGHTVAHSDFWISIIPFLQKEALKGTTRAMAEKRKTNNRDHLIY